MNRVLVRLTVCTALLAVGFAFGRLFQHASSGFHFKVLAEKDYGSPTDPVRWRHVTESVGTPLLDPGTTVIEYRGRTIYKAQRAFQESVPVAANIRTSDQQIEWDDGELRFRLTVEEMKGEPGAAADCSEPDTLLPMKHRLAAPSSR